MPFDPIPRATEAEVERALAARARAVQAGTEDAWSARLDELDLLEERALAKLSPDDEAALVAGRYDAERAADSQLTTLRDFYAERALDPGFASWAARRVKELELEKERVSRMTQAMTERISKRLRRSRTSLWPFLETYVRHTKPTTKGGKTWRFPDTPVNLRQREGQAKLEITDEEGCLAWVKANVPYEVREPENGDAMVHRVERVRVGVLREWLLPQYDAALALADAASSERDSFDSKVTEASQPSGELAEGDRAAFDAEDARISALEAAAANELARFDVRRLPWLGYEPAGDFLSIYQR